MADGGAGPARVLVTLRELPGAARFLLLGVLVNRLGTFMQAFLVLYLVHRGFSEGRAGLALTAFGAGSVLGLLLGGGLSDRLGPRLTIAGTMTATAVLTVCVLFLGSYPLILAAVTVVAAFSQAYRPAAYAMLTGLVPAGRQVMVAAAFRLAVNLGTVAAPLIAVVLIRLSWSLLFWTEGLVGLGYALIAYRMLPPGREVAEQRGTGTAGGYAAVLRDRRYLLFLFAMLVNALIYVQSVAVLPLAVGAARLSTAVYGALLALNALLVVCCELWVTGAVQRWPARLAAGLGLTLLGAGLAMYALPGGLAVFVAATVVWSAAEVIGGPTMFAYPALAAPAAAKGRYLGAAHAMFGLGGALGPALGVAAWQGLHDGVWVGCGLLALLAVAAAAAGIRAPAAAPTAAPSTVDATA